MRSSTPSASSRPAESSTSPISVHPGIQRFGPFPAMRIETRYTVAESGFHVEEVTFVTQYGTHVDAPEHFVEDRCTLERIELEELMLPLFVLHFEDKVAADPEFIVHVDDIKRWEAEHGEIPADSFVAFSSGWYHRMEGGDMNNFDADGVAHCPGWGLDALEYLFEERGVTAVGHETLDTDGSADVRARGSSTARSTCSSPITIRSRSWRTSTSCPRRAA